MGTAAVEGIAWALCVEGMNTLALAYQMPLVTPVNECTTSAAPAMSSELGGLNDWTLVTIVSAAGLRSQGSRSFQA